MAIAKTVADRISFGNMKCIIYNVTGVATGGSIMTERGMDNVWAAKATDNTGTTDSLIETVGAKSSATTRNRVTLTSQATAEGHVWVWGR